MSIKIKTPEPLKFDRLKAVINCAHVINGKSVQLFFEPTEPGHNALNQLGNRLEAVEREQLEARDAQWLEMVGPLVEELQSVTDVYAEVRRGLAVKYPADGWSAETMTIDSARAALSAITEEA